jgi:uncharacterized protein YjbJ (UPF0337 family)
MMDAEDGFSSHAYSLSISLNTIRQLDSKCPRAFTGTLVAIYSMSELCFMRNFATEKCIVIFERGNTMKSSMKDKMKGTFHETKGAVKEMAGKVTDNTKLEIKGKAEKLAGKAQGKLGQVKKVFGK